MKMRTFVGLCAALAFAAGSTAVQALKIDLDVRCDTMDGRRVEYAKETLLSTEVQDAKDTDDETRRTSRLRDHIH